MTAEPGKQDVQRGGPARHPDDSSRETAALYALGSLSPGEARAFEAHLAGCPACAADAAALRETLAEVGRAAALEAEPPAELRARLLARIEAERAAIRDEVQRIDEATARRTQVWKRWGEEAAPAGDPGLSIRRAGEGSWESTAVPGVSVKPLGVDRARRYVTMLVRMEPGSSYPRHRHAGAEECYVLEGDLRVGSAVLRAGDYQRAESESLHGVQSTEGGCLLLIVSSQEDELV